MPIAHLGPHAPTARRHRRRDHEHVDDDQRQRVLAARAVHRPRRPPRRRTAPPSPGTTQNDIVKEYLSRGTYIFPPEASRRLIVDMIAFTVRQVPKWNPINVCSYHLQEAGATPVQELAYALATAIGVLDAVQASGQVAPDDFPPVVGRISFFVNAGIRFVEEMCKMRAFTPAVGPHLPRPLRRDRPQAAPVPLRHAGQLARAHRGPAGEQRAAHHPRDARRHAVAGRPGPRRPAADLERGPRSAPPVGPAVVAALPAGAGLRDRSARVRATCSTGSQVVEAKTGELAGAAEAELEEILALGGAFEAIDEMKARLVASQAERSRRIETGEQVVVGVNRFTEAEPSPARRRRGDPAGGPRGRGRDGRRGDRLARRSVGVGGAASAGRCACGGSGGRQRDARHHGAGRRRWDDRRVGGGAARRVRRVPGPDRCRRGRSGTTASGLPGSPRSGAARPDCSSPNPGSTATPTGPSRSPWPPGMRVSRSSTRASARPSPRSWPAPATRMSI